MIWYRGRSLLIAALVYGGLFGISIQNRPQQRHSYRFSLDPTFSTQVKKEICDFVQVNSSPQASVIKKRFPSIKALRLERKIPNVYKVSADSTMPLCQINHDMVIDQQGNIQSPAHYSPDIIQNLPSIMTKDTSHIFESVPVELISFVTSLSPEILDTFSIIWIDKTKIYFLNKEQKKFVVAARFDECPSLQQISLCKKLFNQQTPERTKFRDCCSVVDVRFKGQIIIYQKKGNLLNDI